MNLIVVSIKFFRSKMHASTSSLSVNFFSGDAPTAWTNVSSNVEDTCRWLRNFRAFQLGVDDVRRMKGSLVPRSSPALRALCVLFVCRAVDGTTFSLEARQEIWPHLSPSAPSSNNIVRTFRRRVEDAIENPDTNKLTIQRQIPRRGASPK